jgi:hypothetical protein
MNSAKCPTCDQWISNVHFEAHDPSILKGGGSGSYTATVFPCGHAIGAVPTLWEVMLKGIQQQNSDIKDRLDQVEYNLSQVLRLLSQIARR